jgi:hypothetical protein
VFVVLKERSFKGIVVNPIGIRDQLKTENNRGGVLGGNPLSSIARLGFGKGRRERLRKSQDGLQSRKKS